MLSLYITIIVKPKLVMGGCYSTSIVFALTMFRSGDPQLQL